MTQDWKKILPNRGKFLKGKRETATETDIRVEKKKNVPGPGAYDKNNEPLLGGRKMDRSGDRAVKEFGFIVQTEW